MTTVAQNPHGRRHTAPLRTRCNENRDRPLETPDPVEEAWLARVVWEKEGRVSGLQPDLQREVRLQLQATRHLLERELSVAH